MRFTSRSAAMLLAAIALPLAASRSAGAQTADLSVLKVDDPDPVTAGGTLTYTLTVSNEGPDAADVALSDPLPAGTTFQSLSAPGGWSCTTPAVGANGSISCSLASFAPGSAVFTLVVTVDSGVGNGTVLTNTATVTSSTADPNPGSESASADTTVTASSTVVSLAKSDTPDPVLAGDDLTYTLTASNSGNAIDSATLSDALPAGTAFVSLAAAAGWSCTTPAAGSGGSISCSAAPFASGNAVFTLVVHVSPSLPGGTSLANQAHLDVTDAGREAAFDASASTLVLSPAALSATKSVAGNFVPGGTVTYTVILTNSASHNQGDNPGDEFADVLPAGLTLTGASATSGTAVANVATNTVTWNGAVAAGAAVTLTIDAVIDAGDGTTISNQGTFAYDADGNGTNEAVGVTDDPDAPGGGDPTRFVVGSDFDPAIPTLDPAGLGLLALLLAAGGAWRLRRKA